MFGGKIGLPEVLILLAIALLIFGPGRLAELGKSMGEGIRNFKSAVKNSEKEAEKKEEVISDEEKVMSQKKEKKETKKIRKEKLVTRP